jgi:hypothetical protein
MQRAWFWGVGGVLIIACGGRTIGDGPPRAEDVAGAASGGRNEPPAGRAGSAGGGTGGAFHVSGSGGAVTMSGSPSAGSGGWSGNAASGSAGEPNPPVDDPDSLASILPLFKVHANCRSCVRAQCPQALRCSAGSRCLEQMQCVVAQCKASPPMVTDDYMANVSNCVHTAGSCRADLEACGLDASCEAGSPETFQAGLAAVDCLEARCFVSCRP